MTKLDDMQAALTAVPGYADNIFVAACGPLRSQADLFRALAHLPERPHAPATIPPDLLAHHVHGLRRLHVPTPEGVALAQTMGMMIRQGYVHRNPNDTHTWRQLYAPGAPSFAKAAIQLGATVCGLSGVGKSEAVERALSLTPQVVVHENVPGFVSPVQQLVWLKVDVPPSGTIRDLVEALALATDQALGTRLSQDLFRGRGPRGSALALEWLSRVAPYFPGLLVFDEMQNLFKLATKAQREHAQSRSALRPTLRVADDEALKLLLTITNTSKIPIVTVSTPDGLQAFNSRMSTGQRLMTAGFHQLPHAASADAPLFADQLFRLLLRYQFLPVPIDASDALRQLVFDLSAGIPRICVSLWIHANLIAARRHAQSLSPEDFRVAAGTVLLPLMPAVQALLSQDPALQRRYEDLLPPRAHPVWQEGP